MGNLGSAPCVPQRPFDDASTHRRNRTSARLSFYVRCRGVFVDHRLTESDCGCLVGRGLPTVCMCRRSDGATVRIVDCVCGMDGGHEMTLRFPTLQLTFWFSSHPCARSLYLVLLSPDLLNNLSLLSPRTDVLFRHPIPSPLPPLVVVST